MLSRAARLNGELLRHRNGGRATRGLTIPLEQTVSLSSPFGKKRIERKITEAYCF
jgi:hypothetical protein